MDASLGVRIALHADRLARSLARACVGLRPLAAHRQAAQMADTAVALDALQALQIHAQFPAQVTFDDILAVLDGVDDLGHLLFIQILRADARVDLGLYQDGLRIDRANAVDVAQRDVDALVTGDVDA